VKKLLALMGLLVLASSAGAAAPSGSPPLFAPARFNTMKSPQSVAIGDLNADGRPDLVAAHGGIDELRHIRAVSVLPQLGRGKFGAARAYPTGKAGDVIGAWSVAIGDLTGDGRTDLATATPGGRSVSVLVNRGGGTFQPSVNYALGPRALGRRDRRSQRGRHGRRGDRESEHGLHPPQPGRRHPW
jgi:hypothetical protein